MSSSSSSSGRSPSGTLNHLAVERERRKSEGGVTKEIHGESDEMSQEGTRVSCNQQHVHLIISMVFLD